MRQTPILNAEMKKAIIELQSLAGELNTLYTEPLRK